MEEIWKDVKGYEGHYQISNLGNLKSLGRYQKSRWGTEFFVKERIMKHCFDGGGYHYCYLSKNDVRKAHKIHRLVCEAFRINYFNKLQVNHKDCNIDNNTLDNLEWNTPKENMIHAWENNRCKSKKGIDNSAHKLTEQQVREIKLLKDKMFQREVGKMFGVSKTIIGKIWRDELWTHVK